MKNNEGERLRAIVSKIVTEMDGAVRVTPSWVATEALIEMDPEKESPTDVRIGCHLYLRHVAREILRKNFEADEPEGETHPLFPELQRRYPESGKSEEPSYVLLEHMTSVDVNANVQRLRGRAEGLAAHADRLEAYGRNRRNVA